MGDLPKGLYGLSVTQLCQGRCLDLCKMNQYGDPLKFNEMSPAMFRNYEFYEKRGEF